MAKCEYLHQIYSNGWIHSAYRCTLWITFRERERESGEEVRVNSLWIFIRWFLKTWSICVCIKKIEGSECFIFTVLALLLLLLMLLLLFSIFFSYCKAKISFFALVFIPFSLHFLPVHTFFYSFYFSIFFFHSLLIYHFDAMRCNIIVLALHFAIAHISTLLKRFHSYLHAMALVLSLCDMQCIYRTLTVSK